MTTCIIFGAYGTLTVHQQGGIVLGGQHWDDDGDLVPGLAQEYEDIRWFDPAFLTGSLLDILDVTFIDADGRWCGPLQRRRDPSTGIVRLQAVLRICGR